MFDQRKYHSNQSVLEVTNPNYEQAPRLSDIQQDWLKRLKQDEIIPKTIADYESKLNVFKKYVGDLEILSITAKQVSNFSADLTEGKVTGKPLSKSSVNKYITALNSFFKPQNVYKFGLNTNRFQRLINILKKLKLSLNLISPLIQAI